MPNKHARVYTDSTPLPTGSVQDVDLTAAHHRHQAAHIADRQIGAAGGRIPAGDSGRPAFLTGRLVAQHRGPGLVDQIGGACGE